jgi:hypothetical protein
MAAQFQGVSEDELLISGFAVVMRPGSRPVSFVNSAESHTPAIRCR